MKRPVAFVFGATALAVGAFAAYQTRTATINGRAAADPPIVQGGKVYVSVNSLREAGADVDVRGNNVAIQFVPVGGRNQVEGAQGRIGEWVSNGAWRVRVTGVKEESNPHGRGPGYTVTVEIRNLGSRAVNIGTSGLRQIQLIDTDGNTLTLGSSSFKNQYTAVAPGNGFTDNLRFGDYANKLTALGKPDKLLMVWGNSGGRTLPAIRIDLREE